MPKVLTGAQVRAFERDGCLSPVRAMSAERARHYRERFEALEARVPDIKKMKAISTDHVRDGSTACPITSLNLCDQQPIENRDRFQHQRRGAAII
jgi:hypothetical protein